LGAHVLLFDYRGYGRSNGDPSMHGLYRDAETAYDWLHERLPSQRIFIYGESLGGGVAAKLALLRPAAGLIFEDTFTSIPDMAAYRYPSLPLEPFVHERYNNLSKIARIHVPVLIFHSKNDEVIPYKMGLALYMAANEPKHLVSLAGSHESAYIVSQA